MYHYGHGVRASRVIAYALYSLAVTNDASVDEKASRNRASLAKKMLPLDIEAAQNLTGRMTSTGNLLKALDQYVKSTTNLSVTR